MDERRCGGGEEVEMRCGAVVWREYQRENHEVGGERTRERMNEGAVEEYDGGSGELREKRIN